MAAPTEKEPSAPPLEEKMDPTPREAAGAMTASTEKEQPSAPRAAAGAMVPQTPPPAYYPPPPPVVMAPMVYGGCMRCGSPAIEYEFDCGIICLIVLLWIFGVGLLGLLFCLIAKREARCMQCGAFGIMCAPGRAIIN